MAALLALTVTEREAWRHLVARDREVSAALAALRADVAAVQGDIEARLGLPPGSLGTTHLMDPDHDRVIETAETDGTTGA